MKEQKKIAEKVSEDLEPLKVYLELLQKLRSSVQPERQAAFGFVMAIVYGVILHKPELLGEKFEQIIELLDITPEELQVLYLPIAFGALAAVDGMNRVRVERVPYIQAYIRVFLLGQKLDG